MPDIHSMRGEVVKETVTVRGEEITVEFDQDAYTPAMEKQIRDASDENQAEIIVKHFCALVKSWDVTDQGEPLPLTPEGLQEVPIAFLGDLLVAVGDSVTPGRAEKNS